MKFLAALFGLFLSSSSAFALDTVKFQPTLRILECPNGFTSRSECRATEKILGVVLVTLDLDVANAKVGSWNQRISEPLSTNFNVTVVKTKGPEGVASYSVSSEAGPARSPFPMANSRLEFLETAAPKSFGISTSGHDFGEKKIVLELRVNNFHGKIFAKKIK